MMGFFKLKNYRFPLVAFSIAALSYGLNNLFIKNLSINTPFEQLFEEYFNDFFAPWVLFAFIEFIIKDQYRKYLTNLWIMHLLIFIQSFVWEVIRPLMVENSDALWMDVLMYALGTYSYFLLRWLFSNLNLFSRVKKA